MPQPILDLGNTANWEQVWAGTVEAPIITSSYYPIPEKYVPLLLQKHILAVSVSSENVPAHWRFAGFLNQRIRLGLLAGGTQDTDVIANRKLWLNRNTLLILPKLTPEYSLSFNIPYWFSNMSFGVYEYIGIDTDTLDVQLNRIEQKIDSL